MFLGGRSMFFGGRMKEYIGKTRERRKARREKLGNKTWENSSFLQTNRKVEMVQHSVLYC